MTRRFLIIAILACGALAAVAAPARAQTSLTKGKENNASANYNEALTMLNYLAT